MISRASGVRSAAAAGRAPLRAAAVPRRAALAVRATADNGKFAFEEGARIRVKEAVKVYHVPKVQELELQGLEGTVQKIAALHKGAVLSANLQYRVRFETSVNGNPVKFMAHLAEDEIEAA